MPTVTDLGQRIKAAYPGSYDGIADDELGRRVKARYPGAYDSFSDAAPAATTPAPPPSTLQQLAHLGALALPRTSDLPWLGGVGGGIAGFALGGPPGAVAGAGIGGGLAEGYRQALTQKNLNPLAMGTRGAEQALYESGGQALSGAAKALADRAIPPKPFPVQLKTIPVKSKILDQYGVNFRKRVEFSPAKPPPEAPPPPALTVADVMHLMARRGLLTRIITSKPVLKRLAALNGPALQSMLRQSPRVLAAYINQPAEPDVTSQP